MLLSDPQPYNMFNHRVAKMPMCISQTSPVILLSFNLVQAPPESSINQFSKILNDQIASSAAVSLILSYHLTTPRSSIIKQQIMQVCVL